MFKFLFGGWSVVVDITEKGLLSKRTSNISNVVENMREEGKKIKEAIARSTHAHIHITIRQNS